MLPTHQCSAQPHPTPPHLGYLPWQWVWLLKRAVGLTLSTVAHFLLSACLCAYLPAEAHLTCATAEAPNHLCLTALGPLLLSTLPAEAHLACVAAEAPVLVDADQFYFGPGGCGLLPLSGLQISLFCNQCAMCLYEMKHCAQWLLLVLARVHSHS